MAVQNQQLQHQMSQLQQHMMCMATAPAPPAYAQQGRPRNRPQHQPAPAPPAPYGMLTPAGGPPLYQASPAPYAPPRPPPSQYNPAYPPPAGPPLAPYPAAPPGFNQLQTPPTNGYAPRPQPAYQQSAKRHNNLNYCWTHGGDSDDNHTSHTCRRPRPRATTRWGAAKKTSRRATAVTPPDREGRNNSI
jgi:hypothetical protein